VCVSLSFSFHLIKFDVLQNVCQSALLNSIAFYTPSVGTQGADYLMHKTWLLVLVILKASYSDHKMDMNLIFYLNLDLFNFNS